MADTVRTTSAADSPARAGGLPVAFLMADQRQRWRAGERIPIERYLEQHPDWRIADHELLDLIYHEILLREGHAEQPALAEYVARFPHLEHDLRLHFEVHAALRTQPLSGDAPEGPPPPARLPGYEMLERLGIGGMGVVYRARQLALDRIVAIKLTLPQGPDAVESGQRLQAEARAVAALRHPHIIQIFEVGSHEGRPYFSMEYIEGGSLAPFLREAPWPARLAAGFLECLARAMQAAHERGIVHRDLKPANILLQPASAGEIEAGQAWALPGTAPVVPKISDFGLAKLLDRPDERTRSGVILGTPSYMAPEQVRREQGEPGPATDVHALGALLYEMLTGGPPFRGSAVLDTLDQVLHQDPLPPRRLQRSVPRDLETICLKCLQKEPARRYAHAAELADDLRRYLAGRAIHARPIGRLEQAWRWARRRPAEAALLATVATFLTVAAVGVLETNVYFRRERNRAVQAEESALVRLRESYLDQARLARANLDVGQRARSLDLLAQAARIQPGLDLRNEAIAWLARPDWQQVRDWEGDPLLANAAFDHTLERYARYEADYAVSVRHAADDRELIRLKPTERAAPITSLLFSPNGRYLAASFWFWMKQPKGMAWVRHSVVWDLETGREAFRLPKAGPGPDFAFSPDSTLFAAATGRHQVSLHEVPSGRKLLTLEPVAFVDQLCFDADGDQLALSSVEEKVAEVYELQEGRRTHRLTHPSGVRGLGWSADGRRLAAGCDDRLLYVWDLERSSVSATLPGHLATVIYCCFDRDGEQIIAAGWDGVCRWWDLTTRQVRLHAPGAWFFLAEDGRRVALRYANRLSTWQRSMPEVCRELRHSDRAETSQEVQHVVNSIDLGPGDFAAGATFDGVHIWDTRSLREVGFLPLAECGMARFDPTGRYLAASGKDGVYRWRFHVEGRSFRAEPPEILPVPRNTSSAHFLCWEPDGSSLLVNDPAGSRALRVHCDPKMRVEEIGPLKIIGPLARSPDGRWIAAGAMRVHGMQVWEEPKHAPAVRIPGSRPGADEIRPAFSPDGRFLIACGQQEYRFHDCGTWQVRHELRREPIQTASGPLAYQPHGNLVALVCVPGHVLLIDRESFEPRATLRSAMPIAISDLCFDPEGRHLAVSTAQHGVQWWDLVALRAELAQLGLDWAD